MDTILWIMEGWQYIYTSIDDAMRLYIFPVYGLMFVYAYARTNPLLISSHSSFPRDMRSVSNETMLPSTAGV